MSRENIIKFSERVKACRRAMGLTQENLGKRLGITKAMISHYETGKYFPDAPILKAMADVFGKSVAYLDGSEESDSRTYSLSELRDAADQQNEENERRCQLTESEFVFPENNYQIPFEESNTPAKILWWTQQIANKPWMNPSLLKYFIRAATARIALDYKNRLFIKPKNAKVGSIDNCLAGATSHKSSQ